MKATTSQTPRSLQCAERIQDCYAHRGSRSAAFLNRKAAYSVFASRYTYRESALVSAYGIPAIYPK